MFERKWAEIRRKLATSMTTPRRFSRWRWLLPLAWHSPQC